jgi:hypothetical protein
MPNLPVLNNLELWLDASDTGSIVLDNGLPSQISDKSSKTGNWLVSRASIVPNSSNGLQSIRFAGTGDALVSSGDITSSSFAFMHSGETHIFGVMKTPVRSLSSSLSSNYLLLNTYNEQSSGPGYRLYFGSSNRHRGTITSHITKSQEGSYVVGLTALGKLEENYWHIFHIVTKPTVSSANNRGTITIGNSSYSNNNFTTSASSSISSQALLKISTNDDGTNSTTGELGELLIYKGSLTDVNIFDIKDFLSDKWGIGEQIIPLTPTPTPTASSTPPPTPTVTRTPTPTPSSEGISYTANTNNPLAISTLHDFTVDKNNLKVFYTLSDRFAGGAFVECRSLIDNSLISRGVVKNTNNFTIGYVSYKGCAYNSNSDRLYVSATRVLSNIGSLPSSIISIMDASSLVSLDQIVLGTTVVGGLTKTYESQSLLYSPKYNKLYSYEYVSNDKSVQKLVSYDMGNNNISTTILSSLYEIYDIQLDDSQDAIFVSTKTGSNTYSIYKINTDTNTVVNTWQFYAKSMFFTSDNKIMYTDGNTFYVKDTTTSNTLFSYPLHIATTNRFNKNGPYSISYNSETKTAYVFNYYANNKEPVFFAFDITSYGLIGKFSFAVGPRYNGVSKTEYIQDIGKNVCLLRSTSRAASGIGYLYVISPENLIKNSKLDRSILTGKCTNTSTFIGKADKADNYSFPWVVSSGADIISMSYCNRLEKYNPFISLGAASGSGYVEQSFQTIPNNIYGVDFQLGNSPGFSSTGERMAKAIVYDSSGLEIFTQIFNTRSVKASNTYAGLGWQTKSFKFTANSNSSKIRFESPDPLISQGGAAIDSVIITRATYSTSPVPTPTPPAVNPPDNLSFLQNSLTFNIGSSQYLSSVAHSQNTPSFYGAVLGSSGKSFLIPYNATNIGICNEQINTHLRTPPFNSYQVGPAHGKVAGAFFGGVAFNDNVIMCPHNSNKIGLYNTTNNYYSDGPSASGFAGAVVSSNNKVIFAPFSNPNIGIYDPVTNAYTAGPSHNAGTSAVFSGAVALTNDKILLVPRNSNNIGLYDPSNNSYTTGPSHGRGSGAFIGGVLLPSANKVVLIPSNSTTIGLYDITTNTYADGPLHGNGANAFAGGVLLPNGQVLLIPYNSSYFGVFSILNNTSYYSNIINLKSSSNANSFAGGLLVSGSSVLLCPANSANIGYVSFTKADISNTVLRSRYINKF